MKDPYLYENSNVLINLENIKDQNELDEFESSMYMLSFAKLDNEGFIINDTSDLLIIHEKLFNQVYDWAGKPRIINMFKEEPVLNGLSVDYSDKKNIVKEINDLNEEFKSIKYNDNKKETVSKITKLISKLWKIHAFREGNTRTIGVFLYFWMKQLKIELNRDFIGKHAKFFRNALVMASIGEYSEYEHLESIINDATIKSTKELNTKDNRYQKINNYDLKDYKYNYHHIKD